jgi:tight adherence protein C
VIEDLIRNMGHTAEIWLLLTIAVAVLSGLQLWGITRRESVPKARLDAYRGTGTVSPRINRFPWHRRLGSAVAISPFVGTVEQQRMLKVLALAGIKGRSSLVNLIAIKVVSALVLAGLAWLVLEWQQPDEMLWWIAALGGALLGGWRAPNFILNRLIAQRRLRLEQGMPDALDLLVVCAEAGLSLNQAIDEVSRQLTRSNNDVADEFAATAAEMRVVSDFGRALDNLVERTGLDDLRSLIATLKQSLRFGTSLAESLRVIASEMRGVRHARIEERAARLPVLLAVPMMLFILPCLLMIVGTPVVLHIIDAFKTFHFGGGLM